MLSTGAAPEILAGNEDLGARVFRAVEHKVRIEGAVGKIAPGGKEPLAHTRLGDSRQKAGGDDLVGVHVFRPQRDGRGV